MVEADILQSEFQKKTYQLSIQKRFADIRRFRIKKRLAEEGEMPILKQLRASLYKLIGRAEE